MSLQPASDQLATASGSAGGANEPEEAGPALGGAVLAQQAGRQRQLGPRGPLADWRLSACL
jgi:hypothetical protein